MMNLISERKKIKQPVFRSATGEMIERKKEKKKNTKRNVFGDHLNFLEAFP